MVTATQTRLFRPLPPPPPPPPAKVATKAPSSSALARHQDAFIPAKPTAKATAAKPAGNPTLAQVNLKDPTLQKLATGKLQPGANHSCVLTCETNMARLGVPRMSTTGNDPNNNPRGAMSQMVNHYGWKSVNLPGSKPTTIKSPYGNVNANVISGKDFEKLAKAGKIPSGALVFETRHPSWNEGAQGSRGFDMAIARNGGKTVYNFADMHGPMVYGSQNGKSGTQQVVVLVPGSSVK